MKTIGVLTSGGDSPGMNTALRSIVRTCAHYKIKCVGIVRGYSGLIEDNTKVLNTRSCLLYTSPSPRDDISSRMPSSA